MRSIHFRVEDDLYRRIQEEAEQQEISVANFARVATVARTILWGVRRGAPWADLEAWGEAAEIIADIERRDTAARAKLAKERRASRSFSEKLEHERAAAP
jgi:phage gp29-like protein